MNNNKAADYWYEIIEDGDSSAARDLVLKYMSALMDNTVMHDVRPAATQSFLNVDEESRRNIAYGIVRALSSCPWITPSDEPVLYETLLTACMLMGNDRSDELWHTFIKLVESLPATAAPYPSDYEILLKYDRGLLDKYMRIVDWQFISSSVEANIRAYDVGENRFKIIYIANPVFITSEFIEIALHASRLQVAVNSLGVLLEHQKQLGHNMPLSDYSIEHYSRVSIQLKNIPLRAAVMLNASGMDEL